MSRYRGPRVKIVKRLGTLPGLTRKSPKKRPNRSRLSQYGIRLCEKQKLRYHYGLNEHQLVRYVKKAKQASGSTSNQFYRCAPIDSPKKPFEYQDMDIDTNLRELRSLRRSGLLIIM